MELHKNIRNFRTFRHITQQKLTDYLGKTKSVISNWERGENSPDVEACEKMCQLFNVTPNQLFGWEENAEYQSYIEKISEYSEQLNELYAKRSSIEQEIDAINQKLNKGKED